MRAGCFRGFRRSDGQVGIRNSLLVLPVGQCANELALRCASEAPDAFPLLHTQPCAHLGEDNEAARRCLVGLGRNPNAAAVLVVGIGCDSLPAKGIAEEIAGTGKPVQWLTVESCGGWESVVRRGRAWLKLQESAVIPQPREEASVSDLVLGIKCGGSDATSALAGNPAIGEAVDRLIGAGGTAIFSETTELIGAEHLLMARAATPLVRSEIQQVVRRVENSILATGVDPRGTQPTPGNIAGGLTTLEEKSLGGVIKTGTRSISAVFPWGARPAGNGLHLMDCPANVPQLLLGWAAAGAQLLLFSVGGGLPARIPSLIGTNVGGLPLLPVIKVLSNPRDRDVAAYFDVDASTVLEGRESLDGVARSLWDRLIATASGRPTYLEDYPAPAVQIWEMLVRGPTI
jgi:altronate dehydratase large subunit